MDNSLKILVSGDVDGKLADLYSKVKSIQNKAGNFDILLCVGEFFSATDNSQIDQVLADPSSIPIKTYVLGPNDPERLKHFRDPTGYEISRDKIIYLGTKGIYTTGQELSIVYLSGTEEKCNSKPTTTAAAAAALATSSAADDATDGSNHTKFNEKDVENLIKNFENKSMECVDILLTNQWPKYVEKKCDQKLENERNSDRFGSELISYLATKLKPRYHFAAIENLFFERIPYRNHQVLKEKERNLTRFLGLARVNKSNKPKYLYAFNIIPAKKCSPKDLAIQNIGSQISDNPYLNNIDSKYQSGLKRSSTANEDNGDKLQPSLQYFYDADHIKKMNELNERAMEKRRRKEENKNKEQEPCWFCLGGTKVEPHFIVSVAEKSYLAYAKGALNRDNLLIISIDHVQSSIHADKELLDEINKYKLALRKYFKTKNKCVLFYERNFRTKHMQIQVFAVDFDKTYLLKDAFMSIAKQENVRLNQIPEFTSLKQVIDKNHSFYYLELPLDEADDDESLEKSERFLSEIHGNHFPLYFGRDVVASELILNMPDRVNWKNCLLMQEEEKKMSQDFRDSFKKFDPFV